MGGMISTITTYFTLLRQVIHSFLYKKTIKEFAGIPGPTPSFPLGNVGYLLTYKQPAWFAHRELVNKYGNMVLFWAFGNPTVWINSPELINEVTNTPENFFKREPCSAVAGVCSPNDPFTANGAEWEKRHKNFALANPIVVKEWVPQQVPVIRQVTQKYLKEYIEETKQKNLLKSIIKIVHDTFMYMNMGQYPNEQAFKDWWYLGSVGDQRIRVKPIGAIPPLNPMVNVTKKRLWTYYDSLIAQALSNPSAGAPPTLAKFIRDKKLRDFNLLGSELPDQLFGGAFSVSTTIASALFFLSQNPQVLEKLRKELSNLKDFTYESLWGAEYLDSIIRESQRVFPPVPTNLRCSSLEKSVQLGGRTIPPGTTIVYSCFTAHTDAEVYSDPETFNPERWEKPGFKQKHEYHTPHFFPFGHGFRVCKPDVLARTIAKAVIAEFATTSSWTTNGELKHNLYFGTNHPNTTTVKFTSLKKNE